jgi:glycosyltransferase involved in cell wall biosynthesis
MTRVLRNIEIATAFWRRKSCNYFTFHAGPDRSLLQSGLFPVYFPHTEGFGMVIIEAMSLGLPVIGLNVGVIGEIVRHRKTGLLPFPEKWQEEFLEDNELAARSLANAIQLLIENSGLAHELGQNARDFARQFEARAFTNRIEAIYTKLYHSRFRP